MELQVVTSGLERGDRRVLLKSRSDLVRQEAKPSQPLGKRCIIAQKAAINRSLCPSAGTAGRELCALGLCKVTGSAAQSYGCCTGHPPLQGFGNVCVTQLSVSSVCVRGSSVSPHCQWDQTCHKCFLFPSDTTSSNSFRSLAK